VLWAQLWCLSDLKKGFSLILTSSSEISSFLWECRISIFFTCYAISRPLDWWSILEEHRLLALGWVAITFLGALNHAVAFHWCFFGKFALENSFDQASGATSKGLISSAAVARLFIHAVSSWAQLGASSSDANACLLGFGHVRVAGKNLLLVSTYIQVRCFGDQAEKRGVSEGRHLLESQIQDLSLLCRVENTISLSRFLVDKPLDLYNFALKWSTATQGIRHLHDVNHNTVVV